MRLIAAIQHRARAAWRAVVRLRSVYLLECIDRDRYLLEHARAVEIPAALRTLAQDKRELVAQLVALDGHPIVQPPSGWSPSTPTANKFSPLHTRTLP